MSLDDPKFEIGLSLEFLLRVRAPELIEPIADGLISADDSHVTKQHVVSRVLLKQFSEKVGEGQRVGSYSVARGMSKPRGLDTAGMVANFLAVASGSAEFLWSGVENDLGQALESLDHESTFYAGINIAVVKGAIALHYARSEAFKQLGETLYSKLKEEFKKQLIKARVETTCKSCSMPRMASTPVRSLHSMRSLIHC